MKKFLFILSFFLISFSSLATIHIVRVWDGYFQFLPNNLTIQLGDTVQWLPLDQPSMVHTITSDSIPAGAASFDQIWQMPADTFFQYVPQVIGLYHYVCTPHAVSWGMVGSFTVTNNTSGLSEQAGSGNEPFFYPNPSRNKITLLADAQNKEYKIYSIKGELVQSGESKESLDVSLLENGIYTLEILGDRPKRAKFVKQ